MSSGRRSRRCRGLLQSLDQGLIEDSPEARGEYYAIMLRQTERLERLINDLLDVSRIDAGRLHVDVHPVEVGEALECEIRDASQMPDAREIRFERPDRADLGPRRPAPARPDRRQPPLQRVQVLTGGHDRGREARDGREPRRRVRSRRGKGIPLAEQDRVFERFYRANNGLTRSKGGFGLGLYIAQRLAQGMGGHLTLDSTPNEGCTFSLRLPLLVVEPNGADGVGLQAFTTHGSTSPAGRAEAAPPSPPL